MIHYSALLRMCGPQLSRSEQRDQGGAWPKWPKGSLNMPLDTGDITKYKCVYAYSCNSTFIAYWNLWRSTIQNVEVVVYGERWVLDNPP